ncbi:cephalotocin receptor 2-like isoform X2 [Ruditapes philippinarum]|uniref:cephalotocin receptor 2-like isoform X2 n=1 Tax=Ruditapes philippinarum TaxID=129788 RepID=UPI00295B0452|nr:cephalotocin receptor 2-like isoform X2 [Ruditapes philippinarum]
MAESSKVDYVPENGETVTIEIEKANKTNKSLPCPNSVHDIELDLKYRLLVLYLTISLCIIGSILVVLWMVYNRRISKKFNHLSRVNAFILNLTLADVLVILLAVFPQLIWEYVDREWVAGDVMCRLVKFLQIFSMVSSNYMLVVIALDRHQAIRSPLKESISVWKMAGAGWALAFIMSLPVMGIFHTKANRENGKIYCENIFRNLPLLHRQIWVTWNFFVVFFVPLIMLVVCYTRIFLKISRKANQNSVKHKPGKVCLQSTHSSSLPRAKLKTLKMTFVIILTFIVCTMPYFIVEMIMSYGNHCIISKKLYALLGGMAACNSATNPYVFLLFNVQFNKLKKLCNCKESDSPMNRGQQSCHTGTTGVSSHSTIHKNNINPNPFFRQDTTDSQMEMKVMFLGK